MVGFAIVYNSYRIEEEENVIYRQILADPPVCVAAAAVPHTALILFCMWCDSEGID